jgi:hypothetical protein
MPETDEEREESEYKKLLSAFWAFINAVKDNNSPWDSLEDLMSLRASQAIQYACDGFGITVEEAIEIITTEVLSPKEQELRDIITAAIDNIVDFSVAEEYQLAEDLPDFDDDEVDEDELADLCAKYNKRYAKTENSDFQYAMYVAAHLYSLKDNTTLMYMTQGDERVRPWHLAYEGYTAPKSSFPEWLVPPIEYQCRCFLIEDSPMGSVQAARSTEALTMPDWFNPVFKESVAFGGRIYSDEHPYFQVEEQHKEKLQEIAARIKAKYFNGN